MCVIIDRNPGVTIPADKLETACEINKHGFGIAYPDKGRLFFLRSTKDNDPKVIADHLQKLKDKRVFLHLRHATVGKVNLDNNHPFIVCTRKRDGIDVAWMHNGTLFDWKPEATSDDSDTLNFHRRMMLPLVKRCAAVSGKKVLDDQILHWILKKEVGYGQSVFLLFDGNGNTHITNKDKGAQFEGWWASNDYSFRTSHYRHSASTREYGSDMGSGGSYDPWAGYGAFDVWNGGSESTSVYTEGWEEELGPKDEATTRATGVMQQMAQAHRELKKFEKQKPVSASDELRVKWECGEVRQRIFDNNMKGVKETIMSEGVVNKELRVYKSSFLQLSGLNSLDSLGRLTEKDLQEAIQNYPNAIGRAVIDLLAEREEMRIRITNQALLINDKHTDKT